MDSEQEVIIEQNKGDKVFVTSKNRKYHVWINLLDDKDWNIEI